MADDLEAFLRQAAQRRAQRKKPAPEPPGQAPRPAPQRQQPPRRQPPAARPPEGDPDLVDAEMVFDVSADEELGIDTTDFAQRAEHLGEEVGLADDQLETHLHERFDHQMGQLRGGLGSLGSLDDTKTETPPAENIAALLVRPQSLRKAVILSEVLNRPEHRW
jgi:hypothetical protein